jgi:hypothetical protein
MFMGDEISGIEKHAIAHRQKNDTKNTPDKEWIKEDLASFFT